MKPTQFRVTVKDFSALSFGDIQIKTTPSTEPRASRPRLAPESAEDLNVQTDGPVTASLAGELGRETHRALPPALNLPKPARVLIADDTPNVRESLAKLLCGEGYEVELAANGREALEKFDPKRIDVVLLDLDMPVTNGWEALAHMMAIHPEQAVIIITGKSEPCGWTGVGGAGILVAKPINVPALLESIRQALTEPAASRKERIAVQHKLTRHTRPLPETFTWQGQRRSSLKNE
jgi:CheY-like chemotaxis protein